MAKEKTYHKENLRGDLLIAGRDYVEQHGHAGLSIRTLAQQVGVSAGAPYHHFPDRRSFLLAIAIEGFNELMASTSMIAEANQSNERKLKRMGLQFIRFAEENPRLMELMYESELTTPEPAPELLKLQMVGHETLKRPIVSALPAASDEDTDIRVAAFWSTIYGFASMRNKGVLRPFKPQQAPGNAFAEAIVDRALLGALAP